MPKKGEYATFGAGCFWGVEAAFRSIRGVLETEVGYEGGHFANPTYEDVCTGRTGHAEVVRVLFDPEKVGYEKLLDVFWAAHDPTTIDRQGPDIGTQYRSIILAQDEKQKTIALASKNKQQASGRFSRDIVTEIVPKAEFYPAEDYHQQYLEKRGLSQCHIRTDQP